MSTGKGIKFQTLKLWSKFDGPNYVRPGHIWWNGMSIHRYILQDSMPARANQKVPDSTTL